jgi:hypothetical protein
MTIAFAPRIRETTTTTGTGTLTLSGIAVPGFGTFAGSGGQGVPSGSTVYYLILDNNTNDYEVGSGVWSSSNTLTRVSIEESSNGGSLVNFASGSKLVMLRTNVDSVATTGASSAPTGEAPSGTINGSNVTFTLSRSPSLLLLFLNGLLQQSSGADYSLSGSTITMTNPPISGDILTAVIW